MIINDNIDYMKMKWSNYIMIYFTISLYVNIFDKRNNIDDHFRLDIILFPPVI